MKTRKCKIILLTLVIAAIVVVGGVFVFKKYYSSEAKLSREKATLPSSASSFQPSSSAKATEDKPASSRENPEIIRNTPYAIRNTDSIPAELNLDVPFTVQAPTANWDYTHEEACEEAAMLMANRYFQGRGISGAADAEQGIQEIIDWEKQNLGFFESTTAEETARVIGEMLGLKTEIISNPTVDDIKQAIANKELVIVPTAGQQVGNPFYKSPGPLYHMLLIKGYTETQFITNDAGTKRGANYPYNFQTVLLANHDWNGGNVPAGAKKIIIVSK